MSPFRWAALSACLFLSAPAVLAQSVLGPEVSEALARNGNVRVVVALDANEAARLGATDALPALQAAVRASQDEVLAALPAGSATVTTRYTSVPALVMEVRSPEALGALVSHPSVVRVDLDGGGGGGGDGYLNSSVALVQANEWHQRGVTGEGVVVAVLDTGVDLDHPDFAGAVVDESCFLDFDGSINGTGRCPDGSDRQVGVGAGEDDHGHGTNVTSIVASRGSISGTGVAPGARIVAVKTLDRTNSFSAFSEIVAALDYLVSNPALGVQVVNMSLGSRALFSGVCDNSASWTVAGASAARTLRTRGVSLFASSMNDGSSTSVAAPACLSAVTAVAASTKSDAMASLSNTGAQVEIVAPGIGITASGRGGGLSTYSGTSQASPHVAGCAALLLAAGVADTPDAIMDAFETAATVTITDADNGRSFPRLDCFDSAFVVAAETEPGDDEVLSLPSPNPARTTARLALRVPQSQSVRVAVLDRLGREVAVAYDGPVAGGTMHPLAVDVRQLPAGVYTLRVLGDAVNAARLLTVIR